MVYSGQKMKNSYFVDITLREISYVYGFGWTE